MNLTGLSWGIFNSIVTYIYARQEVEPDTAAGSWLPWQCAQKDARWLVRPRRRLLTSHAVVVGGTRKRFELYVLHGFKLLRRMKVVDCWHPVAILDRYVFRCLVRKLLATILLHGLCRQAEWTFVSRCTFSFASSMPQYRWVDNESWEPAAVTNDLHSKVMSSAEAGNSNCKVVDSSPTRQAQVNTIFVLEICNPQRYSLTTLACFGCLRSCCRVAKIAVFTLH